MDKFRKYKELRLLFIHSEGPAYVVRMVTSGQRANVETETCCVVGRTHHRVVLRLQVFADIGCVSGDIVGHVCDAHTRYAGDFVCTNQRGPSPLMDRLFEDT